MAYYVGLTDDLDRRRGEHGNPRDWQMTGPFLNVGATVRARTSYPEIHHLWRRRKPVFIIGLDRPPTRLLPR